MPRKMLGLTLRAEADGKSAPSSLQQEFCRVSVFYLPGDIVYNVGLQQQVAAWEQVFSDEVLVGPHSHTVTHTQRAQDVQNLKADTRLSVLLLLRPCKKKIRKPADANTHLVVPSVLVEERDDGFDVVLLDDVENLGALD